MVADQAWFSHTNLLQANTTELTTDSEVATKPVTNVKNRLTNEFWRTEATSAYLRADFGSSVSLQQFTLQFSSPRDPASVLPDPLDPTDTVAIRLSNVSAGGSELLNFSGASNVVRERGYFAYVAENAINARYLEIAINAASRSSLGYFDLPYAHVGAIFQPAIGFNAGAEIDFPDESLINVSPSSGQTFVDSRAELLSFDAVFSLIRESEADSWQQLFERTRTTKEFAFGTRTAGALARRAFICRFVEGGRLRFDEAGYYTARISLIENR